MKGEPRAALSSLGLFRVGRNDEYIELALRLSRSDGTHYSFSKLYFAIGWAGRFSEQQTICFRVQQAGVVERVRLLLPSAAKHHGWVRLRLDAFVQTHGACEVVDARLVGEDSVELSRQAILVALKQRTRELVAERESLPASAHHAQPEHPPESLSVELTAACNLHCPHCSSHGDEATHRMNNRRESLSPALLESLGHEVFPYLTLINLVGRGEPMMVPLPFWNRLFELCERYAVLITCVSNGTFVRQRLDAAKMHLIDTLTLSIDGMTPDVFAENRRGADLATFKDNVSHYQRLCHASDLLRRPRLGFSWTLKRNNIEQFPDFIRFALDCDADLLYVRHLLLFRPSDAEQSLINEPALTNRYLAAGYALLQGHRMKLDVPPLSAISETTGTHLLTRAFPEG